MTSFELHSGRFIGDNKKCYIIANIGQNHFGDENIAFQLIKKAASIGCDCVKFDKSSFNCSTNNLPKRFAECNHYFSDEKLINFKNYAINEGIQFTASPVDIQSIDSLNQIDVPFISINSENVNNYPLVIKAAQKGKPLLISTGMHNMEVITNSVDLASKYNNRIAVLQCTSGSPTPFREVNLNVITLYRKIFPSKVIGFSGNEKSWPITFAAVAMGAKVIERQLILNRDQLSVATGHDDASLVPSEFEQLIVNINLLDQAMGRAEKLRQPCEEYFYSKLGKSIVASRFLQKGTILKMNDLIIKISHPPGIEAHRIFDILGRITVNDIEKNQILTDQDLDFKIDRDFIPNPCLETSL